MFGKKKPKLGFAGKVRTKQEIDTDYHQHALQHGHKSRIIVQLQQEVASHLQKLIDLNSEGMALQAQPPVEEQKEPVVPNDVA